MLSPPPRFTVTAETVHQWHTVPRSRFTTGLRQTHVDNPLTTRPHVAGLATALEPPDAVDALAIMEAGIHFAVIFVEFTQHATSSSRAHAGEVVDEIVAGTVELAGGGGAFINVILTAQPWGTQKGEGGGHI